VHVAELVARLTPPHIHGTWAAILVLSGSERNSVYKRNDDGSLTYERSVDLDRGEMFADEQTRHRNMVVEVEHSSVGKIETLGPAVKLSKSPTSIRRAAPRLGEHSVEVLAEFGYIAKRRSAVCSKRA
jgi:hypothetical protein